MQNVSSENQTVTDLTLFGAEARPFAILNGESVRIIGFANVEGKSPCWAYIGTELTVKYESQGQFKMIDPTYLPASEHALASLGQTLTDAAAGNTRTTR